MIPSGHVAASVVVAAVSGSPVAAFLWGVSQHAVLDYTTPEFRFNVFNPRERWKAMPYLLAETALIFAAVVAVAWSGPLAWWAVAGYLTTELPDVVRSIRDPSKWRRGDHLMPWHRPHADLVRPNWTQGQTLAFSAALIGAAFWLG